MELNPLYIFGCESKRWRNDVSSDVLKEEEEEETNSLSKLVAALLVVIGIEEVVIVEWCEAREWFPQVRRKENDQNLSEQ